MSKQIDVHATLNTALLAILAFIANKYYDRIEQSIQMVQNHETRITVLEKNIPTKQTSYIDIPKAILPEKIKVKNEYVY